MEAMRVQFMREEASAVHTIYMKKHSLRQSTALLPNDKTLFTIGWPPYCSKEAIAELFSRVGQVTNVYLRDQSGLPEGEEETALSGRFHVGYVVFLEESEVTSALKLSSSTSPLPCNTAPVGLMKWCIDYQRQYLDTAALEAAVEQKMATYDMEKEADKAQSRKGFSRPDEEGWITVTRKTSNKINKPRKHRKKQLQLVNMYQFQQRESQRQHIAELRRKFQEDKKRVAIMKANRKFKPF